MDNGGRKHKTNFNFNVTAFILGSQCVRRYHTTKFCLDHCLEVDNNPKNTHLMS